MRPKKRRIRVDHAHAALFTWIDRSADDSAQRIPRAIVEPVVKRVETLFGEKARRSEVEVAREHVAYCRANGPRKGPPRRRATHGSNS